MKTRFIQVLLIPMLAAAQLAHAQTETKEQLTIPLTDPSKPGTLEVHMIKGSIRVTGYAGNQVIVEAAGKSAPQKPEKKDEAAGGMRRIAPSSAALDITATEEKNQVKVNSRFVNRTLDLNIKVPTNFSIKISTVDDGDIVASNVTGTHEISNVNGDITVTNAGGSVVANTINGTLKVAFKTIDTKSPMAFSTLNGNVDVTLPANARFDVKLKSDQGEIFTDFDVQVDQSAPQGTRSAKDGLYRVSIEDWVKGKVNGGGGELMMKNMNGNIYVRKAK